MNRWQIGLISLVALSSSIFGAVAALVVILPRQAIAQEGAAQPQTLTARSFDLVDAGGKLRASLYMAGNGQPRLTMWDQNGKRRSETYLTTAGRPWVSVLDEEEKERAALYLDGDNQPTVGVFDTFERYRVGVWLANDGRPQITLQDQNRFRAGLYLLGDGTPRLTMDDAAGQARQVLGMFNDGTGFQAFLNRDGRVLSWDPVGSALLGPLR